MVESKNEARERRAQRAVAQDEAHYDSAHYESATLSRLTQALGGCATEFATGSVRVAGGLVTDLCGAVLDPVDRLLGTGRYRYASARERAVETEGEKRPQYSVSRAVGRAVSGVADTAARSEERFREAMESGKEPGQKPDDTSH